VTIADVFRQIMGPDARVAFTAFDGSSAGPRDAETSIEVRSPIAVSYLLGSPSELGLPRAYAAGHLEVHGDLYAVLREVAEAADDLDWRTRLSVLRKLGPRYLRLVTPPPEELPARWRRVWHGLRHSRTRDDEAISHHYDVSNRFYSLLLGPSMAYTCACYPTADAMLEQAQEHKFDLVCRKLGLRPGMRLLDVGCGWGGMVLHAARHYGVQALGVTLSRNQADWGQKAVVEAGLANVAEVRHGDYRDITETGFDAVSSIGLTEHIGARNLNPYFAFLYAKLNPRGRLLNHCITRPTTLQPAHSGLFIDRYIFPDGELEGIGQIITEMQNNGFEVRHAENLREHYSRTLAAWSANLEARWDQAVAETSVGKSRVWRLYLATSRLGFDRRMIELHQVLGVRTDPSGESGMPLRPDWGV
jgi:cyclopropane-fatty-acyl-phospholipid synthase